MPKPTRLVHLERIDLPVPEASGAVVVPHAAGDRLLVVGDRSSKVAVAALHAGRPAEWQTVDLRTVSGWPARDGDSQLEAIAADGGSLVAVMREDPAEVLVVDTAQRRLASRITLVVPRWSALAGRWDDPSSRGEGLVLLRGGRLLVAKEKRPRALVEFGPAGTSPRGVGPDDLIGADEPWDAPAGDVTYNALAVWRLKDAAKKSLGDISALAAARDGALWLLSDKSAALARLDLGDRLPRGGGTITSFSEAYRLPSGTPKPEGFAMLDDDTLLVTLDTPDAHSNGLLVRRPTTVDQEH